MDLRSGECNVISLYGLCCPVNGSVCFVCCVFVNCLVKQFAISLGVFVIFVVECDRVVVCCCEVMYFGCFDFRGELCFLICDDIFFESVYVDLQYDEIYITHCWVCVVFVALRLSWYPMLWVRLLL